MSKLIFNMDFASHIILEVFVIEIRGYCGHESFENTQLSKIIAHICDARSIYCVFQ